LLFYFSLLARGILFLHKHLGQYQSNLNYVTDYTLNYALMFCEAFDHDQGIIAAILPERLPIVSE
jgi:hypothetical protein